MASKFRWEGDLVPNLDGFDAQANRAMFAAAEYVAPQIQGFMRTNARWTDRTGNARSGLKAKVVPGNNKIAIVMYHSVPYGVFLEVRWGGKYAIISKAIMFGSPLYVRTVAKLLFKG